MTDYIAPRSAFRNVARVNRVALCLYRTPELEHPMGWFDVAFTTGRAASNDL